MSYIYLEELFEGRQYITCISSRDHLFNQVQLDMLEKLIVISDDYLFTNKLQ
jgi:hypothetical protein